MPTILFIVIIGAAAGFLATRFMQVEAGVPATIAIGIVGALIGWLVLRVLVAVTGWALWFLGALAGAMLLIWALQAFGPTGRR